MEERATTIKYDSGFTPASVRETNSESSEILRELIQLRDTIHYFLAASPSDEKYANGEMLFPFTRWLMESFDYQGSLLEAGNFRSDVPIDGNFNEIAKLVEQQQEGFRSYVRDALVALENSIVCQVSNTADTLSRDSRQSEELHNTLAQIQAGVKSIRRSVGEDANVSLHFEDISAQLADLRGQFNSFSAPREGSENLFLWVLIFLNLVLMGGMTFIGVHLLAL